jgi:molybdate transport system substrate-binding protein
MPRLLTVILALAGALAAGACRGDRGTEAAGAGSAATAGAPAPLTVFAAATTADVVGRLAARFEAETGVRVKTSFAAASTLAKQIEQGARADVFLSGNAEWMDWLAARGRLRAGTRRDLLSNELVLIVPRGKTAAVRFEPSFDVGAALGPRLAMGDPDHVPAGTYAKAALEQLGWWAALGPRVLPAKDVRAALAYVELGEADAGVVYRTDAAMTQRVTVVGTFPAEVVPPIRFPVALLTDAGPAAAPFLDFLASPAAAAEWQAAGFGLAAAAPAAAPAPRPAPPAAPGP